MQLGVGVAEGVKIDKIVRYGYCFGGGPLCFRFSFNTTQAVLHTNKLQRTASPTGLPAMGAADKPWDWHVLGGRTDLKRLPLYATVLPVAFGASDSIVGRTGCQADGYGDQ